MWHTAMHPLSIQCPRLKYAGISNRFEEGCVRLQIGFFSIVGIPMYKAMVAAFEDARPLLDGVMGNYKCWEAAAANGKDPRI